MSMACWGCTGIGKSIPCPPQRHTRESGRHDRDDTEPFRRTLLGEPLEGKLHEWFLWGGTGDGPSRKVRHRASSLPDNGTIRSSSRSSGSDILKGVGGAASITTPRCASQPTGSSSPSGRRFPPQDLVPPRCSRRLPYPTVTDPEDPPLRPERHIANSITTMRIRLINALIKTLPRCPCCGSNAATYRLSLIHIS